MTHLSPQFLQRLGLAPPLAVNIQRGKSFDFDGYTRERIEYRGLENDVIPAFLFTPMHRAPLGGVVVARLGAPQAHPTQPIDSAESGAGRHAPS